MRRNRQRANLDFTGFMMKWQRHFAAPPMITAVRAEPYPSTNGSYTYRESLRHSFDPPGINASRALHSAHIAELTPL
jgi:hypothetical protein